MKSALRTIALSQPDRDRAIVALLEVALEVLDSAGHNLPAVYVDMGLSTFIAQRSAEAERFLDGIDVLQ